MLVVLCIVHTGFFGHWFSLFLTKREGERECVCVPEAPLATWVPYLVSRLAIGGDLVYVYVSRAFSLLFPPRSSSKMLFLSIIQNHCTTCESSCEILVFTSKMGPGGLSNSQICQNGASKTRATKPKLSFLAKMSNPPLMELVHRVATLGHPSVILLPLGSNALDTFGEACVTS